MPTNPLNNNNNNSGSSPGNNQNQGATPSPKSTQKWRASDRKMSVAELTQACTSTLKEQELLENLKAANEQAKAEIQKRLEASYGKFTKFECKTNDDGSVSYTANYKGGASANPMMPSPEKTLTVTLQTMLEKDDSDNITSIRYTMESAKQLPPLRDQYAIFAMRALASNENNSSIADENKKIITISDITKPNEVNLPDTELTINGSKESMPGHVAMCIKAHFDAGFENVIYKGKEYLKNDNPTVQPASIQHATGPSTTTNNTTGNTPATPNMTPGKS